MEALIADFHRHRCRDANHCTELGVPERSGELPDPSLSTAQATLASARELLQRNRALSRTGLDFDAALDLDLMALMLEQEIHHEEMRFNGATTREQLPDAADGLSNGLFALFVSDPRPADQRLADICSRIEQGPDYLQAMLQRLDRPLQRWVDIERDKLAGLPDLLTSLKAWAVAENWPDAGRLQAGCTRLQAALGHYSEGLAALPTTRQLHLSHEDARRVVETAGIELSFAELKAMACEFLAQSREQIEDLRRGLCERYGLPPDTDATALQDDFKQRFAAVPGKPLEAILQRYRDEHARLLAWLEQRDLFPIPPQQALRILQTPSFFAPSIPAGAMEPPAPFREGERLSLVYLTLSEELRAEHTELGIPNMMIHEGVPGHHLQLATASMHPSVIRRHVNASEHAEGWTTMLEDYMLDQGYLGELTDEARFVAKLDLARIGARVVIDLFFMTGDRDYLDLGVDCDISADDPFQAAGNLLAAVTGFVPGRVQAELNWYSQERGYPLCYLTGNRLVWQLKRDLAAHRKDLSSEEQDRLFHRTYLQSGNMPLSFLRKVFVHQGLVAA